MCAQAGQALSYALAATADDPAISGLIVVGVEAAPDSSRVIVTVAPPPASRWTRPTSCPPGPGRPPA